MHTDNIKKGISLYRIFSRAYFHLPFMVIFLALKNISIFKIELIMSIYGLSVYLYTFFNKKHNVFWYLSSKEKIVLSEILKVFGLIIIIFSTTFFSIAVAQIFLGLGYGLSAGEDTKIINNYINDGGKFQSKSNGYMFISLLSAGLFGSFLFNINDKFPFIATGITSVIAIISCIFFIPNSKAVKKSKIGITDSYIKISNSEMNIVLDYAVLRGIILTFFTGFLPYHLFIDLKVPLYGFIAILTSYTLFGNLSSNFYQKYKNKNFMMIIYISLFIALILSLSSNLIAIITSVILLGVTSGMTRPAGFNKLKELGSDIGYISNKMESLYSLINIFILLIGGYLYNKFSFNVVVVLLILFYGCYFIFKVIVDDNLKKGVKEIEN